jgi:ketosteroid isomerase-like protein
MITLTLVEHLLECAGGRRWDELPSLLTTDYEIVEPDSLPWGGTHRGTDGYVALMQRIGRLFELRFELDQLRELDAETVVLTMMTVTFTARATGRTSRQPTIELLTIREGRIARSEVFLKDTAGLLTTLT